MKLIGVDVDGTLLNSENKITPKTRQALIRAGEMGHKIVIVSGRPTSAVKDLAKELNLTNLMACYQTIMVEQSQITLVAKF